MVVHKSKSIAVNRSKSFGGKPNLPRSSSRSLMISTHERQFCYKLSSGLKKKCFFFKEIRELEKLLRPPINSE